MKLDVKTLEEAIKARTTTNIPKLKVGLWYLFIDGRLYVGSKGQKSWKSKEHATSSFVQSEIERALELETHRLVQQQSPELFEVAWDDKLMVRPGFQVSVWREEAAARNEWKKKHLKYVQGQFSIEDQIQEELKYAAEQKQKAEDESDGKEYQFWSGYELGILSIRKRIG